MSLETEASDQLLMALEDDELRFNSTTLKELSKALQDDSINIIGLHGKRGSGKTTLVGVVRDKAKSLKMFYAVLFVSMSKIPNPSKIQDLIAEQLNQIFGRAKELKSKLGRMDQILVILDDVPAKFDPEKCMGINCDDPQCKFLLTARSDQDCILLMGERKIPCQKMIPMGPLSSKDTWRLLQKHSGIEDDKSNLSNVGNEIAFNDEWFPGLTIEIGSFLKDRPSKEWKGILDGLRHASASASCDIFLSFRGMDTDLFTSDLGVELKKNGFKIFKNDTKLGDEDSTLPEHVIKAIEDSILSIVVLSENYVGSAKCLDELVHILKCRTTKNQWVWPIYYGYESMFIKNHGNQQWGFHKFCEQKLEKKINKDPKKIEKWRSALLEVSRLDGKIANRGSNSLLGVPDRDFIENYVSKVETAEIFLYKQSMDKAEEIEWSNADCGFELFFTQGRLLVALEEDEIRFNSTTLKELSKELQDDSINKIGLHGKQGSGKTTLVKAVYDKVKCLKIFNAVLFATVSQNPDIWSIQDQFAESLSLKLENEGDFGRALKIRLTLSGMNRILVILDDVPAKFDSERCMGVSCNDERCKFLLTTRHKQGCTLGIGKKEIHCQKIIPMGPLSPKDAWRILQQHSGIEDDESNLSNVANEIASYEWFPGSIIEIARSLKGQPYKEWEGLLNSLRHSTARYQIFLSFRGIDTRHPFASTLCAALKKNGFKTFMDDIGLRDGDSVSTELVNAIEDSRLSVVILSEHYSNSSWCLDELVHILECKKTKKQLVWPIFYKVEPAHVKYQIEGFGKAMEKLKERFKNDPEKIEKWKSALAEVAQLRGRPFVEGTSQPKFIQEYVEAVEEAKNFLYIQNMDMN